MRVLFVCSGNNGISPIVESQAESLKKSGVELDVFAIKGRGLWNYLKAIPALRNKIRTFKPQIVHSHYSLSSMVTSLSTSLPVISSLMGSDVNRSGILRHIIRFFIKHSWKVTIVKSEKMRSLLEYDAVKVIPNGVDRDIFKPLNRMECRDKLGWDRTNKYVLFAADPARDVKNISLTKKAMQLVNYGSLQLKTVYGISHTDMPVYINASDVIILTSKWEGSPNIIKEAMACNIPIVSTDVGDVRWLLGDLEGHYVSKTSPEDVGDALSAALRFTGSTSGRERLGLLGLDSKSIAMQLMQIYEKTSDQ
jgi:teichuronic acid biosynthesis glycosyltransferase TuaC